MNTCAEMEKNGQYNTKSNYEVIICILLDVLKVFNGENVNLFIYALLNLYL